MHTPPLESLNFNKGVCIVSIYISLTK